MARRRAPGTMAATTWWRGALLLASLVLAGCASTHLGSDGREVKGADHPGATGEPATIRHLANQRYTPDDWPEPLSARVRLPRGDSDELRPAALLVHGGGWRNRTPDDMEEIAEALSLRGFVTVNIEHRFAPDYRFPAQLHDLQQAMAWLHANAEAWRVDTDRIVGVGFSSGAHLVSLLALAGSDGPLAAPHGGEHARLAAVVAGGTPTDLLNPPTIHSENRIADSYPSHALCCQSVESDTGVLGVPVDFCEAARGAALRRHPW